MPAPVPTEDALAKRASVLRGMIESMLSSPTNGVSQLNSELRALSNALGRFLSGSTTRAPHPDSRNLAEVTMIHLEPALKLVPEITMHGPELTFKSDAVRQRLTASLAQLLSFGVTTVVRDEGAIASLGAQVKTAPDAQKNEYDSILAKAYAALATAEKAISMATESVKSTVHMTAFSTAKDCHRPNAIE